MGRPQPRVDDPEPDAPAQLRRGADGDPPRRVLAPQVRRGRAPAGPCASRRLPMWCERGDAADVHLPVAVVLADRARLRSAAHRLRRDLQPRLWPSSVASSCSAAVYGWGLEPATEPEPGHGDDGHGGHVHARRAAEPRRRRGRRRRASPLADTHAAGARDGGRPTPVPVTARPSRPPHVARGHQREAGDVGVPRRPTACCSAP